MKKLISFEALVGDFTVYNKREIIKTVCELKDDQKQIALFSLNDMNIIFFLISICNKTMIYIFNQIRRRLKVRILVHWQVF